jgi:hypothetical protein
VQILRSVLRLDARRRARVRVRCPAAARTPCAGRLSLARVRSIPRRGRRPRVVTTPLGSAPYRISPKRAAVVRVPVSRRGLSLLRRGRATTVIVIARPAARGVRTVRRRLPLLR